MAPKKNERTSARSSGRTTPTTSQNRGNRQRQSSARVSNSSGRGGTNSARVSTGRGGQQPRGTARITGAEKPKALPPGKTGGALATRPRGGALTTTAGRTFGIPSPGPAGKVVGKAVGKMGLGGLFGAGVMAGQQVADIANDMPKTVEAVKQLVQMARGRRNPQSGELYGESMGPNKEQQARNAAADQKRAAMRQQNEAMMKRGEGGEQGAPNRLPAAPASRGGGGGGGGGARVPAPAQRGGGGGANLPAAVAAKMSSNMDENYATWARANPKLAAKVKKGQAGYEAIQRAINPSKAEPAQPETPAPSAPQLRQMEPLSESEKGAYNSNDEPNFNLRLPKDPQWLKDLKKRQKM